MPAAGGRARGDEGPSRARPWRAGDRAPGPRGAPVAICPPKPRPPHAQSQPSCLCRPAARQARLPGPRAAAFGAAHEVSACTRSCFRTSSAASKPKRGFPQGQGLPGGFGSRRRFFLPVRSSGTRLSLTGRASPGSASEALARWRRAPRGRPSPRGPVVPVASRGGHGRPCDSSSCRVFSRGGWGGRRERGLAWAVRAVGAHSQPAVRLAHGRPLFLSGSGSCLSSGWREHRLGTPPWPDARAEGSRAPAGAEKPGARLPCACALPGTPALRVARPQPGARRPSAPTDPRLCLLSNMDITLE